MVYGGDEVTFITPAWLGWKALRAFYREAEDWAPVKLVEVEHLTYSAAVVFCHHNAPIHAIKELACELADQAKERALKEFKRKNNFAACQVLERIRPPFVSALDIP